MAKKNAKKKAANETEGKAEISMGAPELQVSPELRLRIECLMLAQAFETYWAYYLQSDGGLFGDECRKAAMLFLEALDELKRADPRVVDPVVLRMGENTDVVAIVDRLREWAIDDRPFPYERAFQNRWMVWGILNCLKSVLISDLKLTRWPPITIRSEEAEHSEQVIRWKGHLPDAALRDDPAAIVRAASESQTIAVVGDIRRSQDLMTYCSDAEDFSSKMVSFIERTRRLLKEHFGFFDKFTGDGFVAYFNQTVCEQADADFRDCFLSFVREELAFALDHFQLWCRAIRKLPTTDIGLAIGADLGPVAFQDMQNHLVAVGEPIVWAARMASAACANELVVNNLLYCELEEKEELSFTIRESTTNAGEPFAARIVTFCER